MATVSFTIPNEHLQRFINGMAEHYGYRELDENGDPNPETKVQYGKRKIRQEWIQRVKRVEHKAEASAIVIEEIEVTD